MLSGLKLGLHQITKTNGMMVDLLNSVEVVVGDSSSSTYHRFLKFFSPQARVLHQQPTPVQAQVVALAG